MEKYKDIIVVCLFTLGREYHFHIFATRLERPIEREVPEYWCTAIRHCNVKCNTVSGGILVLELTVHLCVSRPCSPSEIQKPLPDHSRSALLAQ
jgi:hypothetical protein